eukprot:g6138.t1
MRACFAFQNAKENVNKDNSPQGVEVLRRSSVCFKPGSAVKEPLAPVDLLPFCFRHYMPWAYLFDYDIEFQRLIEALRVVSKKYVLLSGRLSQDETGRYCIEVGTNVKRIYDFPVVEVCARMSMAEAVLQHGRVTTNSAEYPVHPDTLPFYLDLLDMDAIHKGQDPFLKVKLTHFSDGSCLSISMSHFLMDGMRFSELFRDISRAYCRKEVSMRDIKREYMMFESFSKHFNEKDKEGCVIPKTVPTGRESLAFKQYPNETSSLEILYLSKAIMDEMKSRLASFIPKRRFVSTADIMQALFWMLSCEMNSDAEEIRDSTDLGIAGTTSAMIGEIRQYGFDIIPKDYLGNAVFNPVLFAGEEMKFKSLLEALAVLSLQVRQKLIESRNQRKHVFNFLTELYTPLDSIPEQSRGAVSNLCKLPISGIDFGQGSTALFLCHANLPVIASGWFVTPVIHHGGILVHLTITKKQKARMKRSSVLKDCAPGVKNLFEDFDAETLNKLMKKN